jgi:hypothetical protein
MASLILSRSETTENATMTRQPFLKVERECTLEMAYVLSEPVCRPRGSSDQDGARGGRRHLAQGRYRRTRAPHPQTRSQLERCKRGRHVSENHDVQTLGKGKAYIDIQLCSILQSCR